MTHPHYDHYSPLTIKRLDGLYGAVDARTNEHLRGEVIGPDVLDIGCGFGSLVDHLRVHGLHPVGIDLLDHQIAAGRERFPAADLRVVATGAELPFPDNSFDTVILKESLHHLAAEGNIDESMAELARVCRRRVIVYEPNPTFLLKISRTLIGHVDPWCSPAMARDFLKRGGFKARRLTFSDSLAFPLSGGYVARPLAPRRAATMLFALDNALVRSFGRRVSWRYTLVADKGLATGSERTHGDMPSDRADPGGTGTRFGLHILSPAKARDPRRTRSPSSPVLQSRKADGASP